LLKEKRLETGKTQEEIAKKIGVSVVVLELAEKNPGNTPFKVLSAICNELNIDMDDLFPDDPEEEYQINVGSPYFKMFGKVNFLKSYLKEYPAKLPAVSIKQIESVLTSINMVARKPNLGVMGRSDSGKSHFINQLLNKDCLPAKLQPTTSAVTVIRHIEDRPLGIKDNVIIFKEMVTLDNLDSLEYCSNKEKFYKSGDYSILSSEIVHDHVNGTLSEAYSCVVYIDADILNACNIFDAPGFANTDTERGNQSDTAKAISILSMLDILVYMSPVTGCMDSTDLISLRTVFKSLPEPAENTPSLPVLSNLFFVTSHAAPHIKTDNLDDLRKTVTNRIYTNFYIEDGKGVLEERATSCGKKITPETLEDRWYFFWSSTKERRDPLFSDISGLLTSSMPAIISSNINSVISDTKKHNEEYIKTAISTAENQLIKYEDLLKTYREQLKDEVKKKKLFEIETLHNDLSIMVKNSKQNVIAGVKKSITSDIDVKYIETILKEKYPSKKERKEAEKYAYSHIIERVQSNVESVFLKGTILLEQKINDNLEECSVSLNKVSESDVSIKTPFDTKGAFTGATASLGVAAGLGVYASTMGTLGGYAVAAQGVGLLSSLGIGFGATGGTAGVMSGIAFVGGPVVITLAIAAAVGFLFSYFGDSWEKRLAEEIVKNINENNIYTTLIKSVTEQLDSLEKSVDSGCHNLKSEYLAHLELIQNELNNPSKTKKDLYSHIDKLRESLSFFADAPWDLS